MTQSGYAIKQTNKRFEDLESLKKNMGSFYHNVVEHIRHFSQTCADAAAALENVSGETIAAMSDETLNIWQKTDQVGTDGVATGKITWSTGAGVKTSATFTLDDTDTTTHVVLVPASGAAADFIESIELDAIDCADEILVGNVAGAEIYAVIPVGYHQCLKSAFMAEADHRTFIAGISVNLNIVTAVVTLVCTFTPVGSALTTTKTFITQLADREWNPCIEVEPGTTITWTIEDDNAAHPVATVNIIYVEAYD